MSDSKLSDFKISYVNTQFLDDYTGKTMYFPCIVYTPTEQVLMVPAMYSKTYYKNKNSSRRALKVLCHFCRWYIERVQNKNKVHDIITRFEEFVTKADIDEWLSFRVILRESQEKNSPADTNIESDGDTLARYLTWAKKHLEKRGSFSVYDGGEKVTRVRFLKNTDFFKGMKEKIKCETIDHKLHVEYEPKAGADAKKMARRSQLTKGHEYLRQNELALFFRAFFDKMWTIVCMAAYHTGMRPHEVLAIPRLAIRQAQDGSMFTSDPSMISTLMAKGQKEMTYWCLGKSGKLRPVKFRVADWYAIMSAYEPIFQERKKLYEHYLPLGEEMNQAHLWLARPWGEDPSPKLKYCLPGDSGKYDEYVKPLWNAVAGARRRHKLEDKFGHGVDFYSLRHSFATDFLIREIAKEEKRRKDEGLSPKSTSSIIHDLKLRDRLMTQLGHEDFSTSWDNYVHNVAEDGAIELPSVLDLLKNHNVI